VHWASLEASALGGLIAACPTWKKKGKKLETTPRISSAATNVIKIMIPKMADTSKDELPLGGGIRHVTATSQYSRA